MRTLLLTSCLALAGCSSLLGIDDFSRDDGTTVPGDDDPTLPPDGGDDPTLPPDGDVPATITLSGQTVFDRGELASQSIPNTPIVFKRGTELLSSGSTGLNGDFALAIPTGGRPLDGYLELELSSDAYVPRGYAFGLTGSRHISVVAYSLDRMAQLAAAASATQTTATGCIYLEIHNAVSGGGTPGVTIDTGGVGQLRYHDDSVNTPTTTPTQTGQFGAAWIFGVTGTVTVTARKGSASVSRTVEVPPQTLVSFGVFMPES